MSGTEPSSWVAELFVFLSDAAGYLEIEGEKWAFKSSASLFKGWNIVTRNNLKFLPSLHCGQFGVNRPGIPGSFDLVEFLIALNGSHTIR